MSVAIKMTGDERDLVKAQERVEKGAAGITAEYKKLSKESLETQRYAKKAWEESLPPLVKYQQQMERLKAEYNANQITAEQYKAAIAKVDAQHQSAGTSGLKSLKGIGIELASMIGAYASIDTAVQTIVNMHDAWLENTNEIATSTNAAMKEVVAFAAMQEPGVARGRAIEVASRYAGVMSAGESWDTVQAMQSAMKNDYQKALGATDLIVDAMRLQVKKEDALETARQAVVQNQNIGEYLRAVAITGKEGIRDAPTMAKASRALQNWDDKTFGWSAGAVIGGAYGDQVETYLKQAGVALTDVSKAKDWFHSRGLGADATQQQRLEELVNASKDTVAELADIGLVDAEARGALLVLVQNFDTVMRDYKTIAGAVADQSFMRAERSRAESGVPEIGLAEQIGASQGRFQAARMFGRQEQEHQLRAGLLAEELQARGINQLLGVRMFDAQGNLNEALSARFMRVYNAELVAEARATANVRAHQILEGIERNTVKPLPTPTVPRPEQ